MITVVLLVKTEAVNIIQNPTKYMSNIYGIELSEDEELEAEKLGLEDYIEKDDK